MTNSHARLQQEKRPVICLERPWHSWRNSVRTLNCLGGQEERTSSFSVFIIPRGMPIVTVPSFGELAIRFFTVIRVIDKIAPTIDGADEGLPPLLRCSTVKQPCLTRYIPLDMELHVHNPQPKGTMSCLQSCIKANGTKIRNCEFSGAANFWERLSFYGGAES